MAIQFPSPAYQGESYLAENGVEYIFDGIKWVGFGSTVNPVSDHLHAGNVDLYLFSNGVVQLPEQGDIVDANGTSVIGGMSASTGNFVFDGDIVNMPGSARLNSGGMGNTGAAEIGTDVLFYSYQQPSTVVQHSEIFMGSGAGEFRSIYDNSDSIQNSLTYAGVEDTGSGYFSGIVSQTPGVNSMYSVAIDGNNNIIIGAAQQEGSLTSDDWGTGLGTLNAGYTVNGIYANTTQTQINGGTATTKINLSDDGLVVSTADTQSWTFGPDGNLTFPNGNLTIGHDPYGDPAILAAPGKNIGLVSSGVGDGYEVGSSLIWVDSITEPTKMAGVTANNPLYVGAGDVGIVTGDYFYTGNTNVWNFGADGNITLPANGYILNSDLTVYGGGGTIWTNPANGCLRAELSDTGFQAYTTASHLDLEDGGLWNIGSYQNSTSIGNDQFSNLHILSLRSGDDTFITTNLRENGNHQWKFGTDAKLTLPDFGAITSPNYGFSFNKNSGKTGVPELGTDVTFATESRDSDIVDGEVYMGSGYGEFRSIYNKVDSTESGLVYAGVEGFNYANFGDVNFAGMVSQTPNIDSMYALSLNEQGQITIGFTQNGQTQTSNDWSVVVGTLNTDYTVNGLFANTNVTVIGSGLSSWTFDKDGTTTFPTGGRISTTGKGGTSLDGGLDGGWTSLTNYYANGNYAACVTAYSNGRLYITTYNDGGPDPSREWAFDNTGNLTLPANGYILNSDLTVYGGGGGGGNYSNSNVSDYMPVYSGNIGGNIVHNGYSWTFGDDGNLFLPDGGMLTNIFGETTLTNPAGAAISASIGNAIAVSEQYGAAVYVNNNAWQFQANANVILPPGGYILNSSGSIYGQSAAAGIGTQNIELSTDLSFLLDSLTGNIMYITKNQYYSGTDEHAILLSVTPADGTRIVFYNETDLMANVHYGDLYYLIDPTGRLEMAYSYYQGSPSWLPIAYTIFSP